MSGMIGSVTLRIPIYHLFCCVASPLLIAFLYGLARRPRVKLTGTFPARSTAGQDVVGEFRVQNLSTKHAYDVGLGYLDLPAQVRELSHSDVVDIIPGGEEATVRVRLRPFRRGLYDLSALKCFTTFPFRLWRTGRKVSTPSSLVVLPPFHSLTDVDVPISRKYQPGGISMSANLGESTEYIGNRNYLPGDPQRLIDFRAWARLTQPAVREYHEEYYCRIALVLDTFVARRRFAPRTGFRDLEAAISLSAAIADALARGEYIIDLFAAGPDLYVFRSGRNIAHFDNVLEILACLDPCRSKPFQTIGPALTDELANITAVVYVLLDWDDEREQFVRAAVEAGARTKVIIVRDGETTSSYADAENWAGPVTLLTPAQVQDGTVETL